MSVIKLRRQKGSELKWRNEMSVIICICSKCRKKYITGSPVDKKSGKHMEIELVYCPFCNKEFHHAVQRVLKHGGYDEAVKLYKWRRKASALVI